MQNKEPTQEQVKEFWEWCGFRVTPHYKWCVDPSNNYCGKYPPIDLNNLFLWAVPIAVERIAKEYKMDLVEAKHLLFHEWFNMIRQGLEDAIALFWVLDKGGKVNEQ